MTQSLLDLQKLVMSFSVKHGQHAGKPYAEILKGNKVVATLMLNSPNAILAWQGKSSLLYPRGLKSYSTSWSTDGHDWVAAVELAVCRYVSYHVRDFADEQTRQFKR